MRTYYFLPLFILLFSCGSNPSSDQKKKHQNTASEIHESTFQDILDSAQVNGSILIYDVEKDTYLSNDFDWAKTGKLPASTFKIPNSMIALETGVVENDSTILKWDGRPKAIKVWEQDLPFYKAFKYSCVPCYQEIARKVGVDKMNDYLKKLAYKGMDVREENIDMFWLVGASRITQYQKIDFLNRLIDSKLLISDRTEKIIKQIMVIDEKPNYTLRGKTGWSTDNNVNNGWFVGYITFENNTYIFATNLEPQETFDMKGFPRVRSAVTMEAFKALQLL
ncbi:class D beta-lactamase [Flammeovirga sp. MY04]|uniref:class D beta-lactamase n=1 Tax=Flammeovirga sp. MY04 TaxID=1191459 RepID=UPI0008061D3C|nr:class D beta-lactamase [Flammeovirga sp. MY04]ANQ49205.1 class D beta-lactamase [Flammeovirga sp. MY04]